MTWTTQSNLRNTVIWMSLLALAVSAALVKLGFAVAMVNVLSIALTVAVCIAAVFGAALVWMILRQRS
jgi:hypothetical protein